MKHHDIERAVEPHDHDVSDKITLERGSEGVVTQTGVKKVEAVAMTWTRQSLYIAYSGFVNYRFNLFSS